MPTIVIGVAALPRIQRHYPWAQSRQQLPTMRSIIRQNPSQSALPDFRNLGTILRTLLAANVLVAIGVLVRVTAWSTWQAEWMDSVAIVEPYLLLELALLYAVAPWLDRLSYREGVMVIIALTL